MAEPLTLNYIEVLARSIFAQLNTVTGTRSTGTVTVTGTVGSGGATLPRNSYLVPIVRGDEREELAFKIGPDPTTLNPNGTGGDWAIADGAAVPAVDLLSNVGGARHNLDTGTELRFDPILPGIEPLVTVETPGIANGANGELVQQVAFFE